MASEIVHFDGEALSCPAHTGFFPWVVTGKANSVELAEAVIKPAEPITVYQTLLVSRSVRYMRPKTHDTFRSWSKRAHAKSRAQIDAANAAVQAGRRLAFMMLRTHEAHRLASILREHGFFPMHMQSVAMWWRCKGGIESKAPIYAAAQGTSWDEANFGQMARLFGLEGCRFERSIGPAGTEPLLRDEEPKMFMSTLPYSAMPVPAPSGRSVLGRDAEKAAAAMPGHHSDDQPSLRQKSEQRASGSSLALQKADKQEEECVNGNVGDAGESGASEQKEPSHATVSTPYATRADTTSHEPPKASVSDLCVQSSQRSDERPDQSMTMCRNSATVGMEEPTGEKLEVVGPVALAHELTTNDLGSATKVPDKPSGGDRQEGSETDEVVTIQKENLGSSTTKCRYSNSRPLEGQKEGVVSKVGKEFWEDIQLNGQDATEVASPDEWVLVEEEVKVPSQEQRNGTWWFRLGFSFRG